MKPARLVTSLPTIQLFRRPDAWYARFSDPAVRAAMGSDIIPTAFLACAPAADVFRALSDLNPHALVELL